jgi:hypothetical protein
MMDTKPLLEFAMRLSEALEESFGDDAILRDVAFVCDIEDGDDTVVFPFCTDPRRWVGRALLDEGITTLDAIPREGVEGEE